MPQGDPTLIDIRNYLAVQRSEQYRSFIIHSRPMSGKTNFAKKLAELEGGAYFDVLAHVAASPQLSSDIDMLDVRQLRSLSLECANEANLVVIDEFDFLIPVWGDDLSGLRELVRKLRSSETPAILVFIMQSRQELSDWQLSNTKGQSRVLSLSEIKSLP